MKIKFVQSCGDGSYAVQGLALVQSLERVMPDDVEWEMVWHTPDEAFYYELQHLHARLNGPTTWRPQDPMHWNAGASPGFLNEYHKRQGETKSKEWWWQFASHAAHCAIEEEPSAVVAYVDSDCLFFSNPVPQIVASLSEGADVAMCTHRWPAHRAAAASRGHWWSGFNVFAPTVRARGAAAWWAAVVRAQCDHVHPGDEYLNIPAGFAADQAWLEGIYRVADVVPILHHGVGLSSWNADGYTYEAATDEDNAAWVLLGQVGQPEHAAVYSPLVLWHAHEYVVDVNGTMVEGTGYPIPEDCVRLVVGPWQKAMREAARTWKDA